MSPPRLSRTAGKGSSAGRDHRQFLDCSRERHVQEAAAGSAVVTVDHEGAGGHDHDRVELQALGLRRREQRHDVPGTGAKAFADIESDLVERLAHGGEMGIRRDHAHGRPPARRVEQPLRPPPRRVARPPQR